LDDTEAIEQSTKTRGTAVDKREVITKEKVHFSLSVAKGWLGIHHSFSPSVKWSGKLRRGNAGKSRSHADKVSICVTSVNLCDLTFAQLGYCPKTLTRLGHCPKQNYRSNSCLEFCKQCFKLLQVIQPPQWITRKCNKLRTNKPLYANHGNQLFYCLGFPVEFLNTQRNKGLTRTNRMEKINNIHELKASVVGKKREIWFLLKDHG
jgi:hypothetical protein